MGYFVQDDAAVPARTPDTHTRSWELSGGGLRYYIPGIGRWISRDPLGDEAFFIAYTRKLGSEDRAKVRGASYMSVFVFVLNSPVGRADPRGLYVFEGPIDQFIAEAEKRRGHGPWGDSAQHCWAACRIGLMNTILGNLAAAISDLNEIISPSKDTLKDIAGQHAGALCAAALPLFSKLSPGAACDCCCQSW